MGPSHWTRRKTWQGRHDQILRKNFFSGSPGITDLMGGMGDLMQAATGQEKARIFLRTAGRFSGGFLGTQLGADAGTKLGGLIVLPGPGTVIGATVGGYVGAEIGAACGQRLA